MEHEEIKASHSATTGNDSRVYLLAFPASFEPSTLDLARWMRFVATGWVILGVACAAGMAGGFAASFLARKQYAAQSIVIVADAGSSKSLLGSVLSDFGASGVAATLGIGASENTKTEALAYLRSTEFAEAMIVKHVLFGDLFPDDWDPARGTWRDQADAPSMNEAVKTYREKHFGIAENRTAGTIAVSFKSPRRESLAPVVNGMIVELNKAMRDRATAEADRSIAYLNEQLQVATTVEMRGLIFRLLEGQYNRRMLAHVREEYALKVVDPARIPDEKRYVSPRRSFWAAFGALAGICLGFMLLLHRAAGDGVQSKLS